MNLFRSEEMSYFQLSMSRETSWETLNELGDLSCLQFIDQDPQTAAFARPFADHIKRIDELEIKVNLIANEMKRFGKPVLPFQDVNKFLPELKGFLNNRNLQENTYFEEIEKLTL
jgi:hypothetical protein